MNYHSICNRINKLSSVNAVCIVMERESTRTTQTAFAEENRIYTFAEKKPRYWVGFKGGSQMGFESRINCWIRRGGGEGMMKVDVLHRFSSIGWTSE
jgi:hypothetical protein